MPKRNAPLTAPRRFLNSRLWAAGCCSLLASAALLGHSLAAMPIEPASDDETPGPRIVLVAGRASHDYGSHEHYAGSQLLASVLRAAHPKLQVDVVRDGWPTDPSVIDQADALVIYSDGGQGHPSLPHLEQLQQHVEAGKGLVCLHYAVEVPKGEPGDRFLDFLGGYFETHWSVNPHWEADFQQLPDHPITRGVPPFRLNDEWYFNMRFRPEMEGITPILTAVPPEETMRRPDGPHSGNPDVRRSVAAGEPQHVAWAFQRPDGGRSFGFTGGHFHWNWGRPEQLRLVANAILWTSGLEVPAEGAPLQPIDIKRLQANQDFEPPASFQATQVAQQYRLAERSLQPTSGQPDASRPGNSTLQVEPPQP